MPDFIVAHSLSDIKQQLELAKAAHRPVLLDFYATWCADCVAMDHQLFSKPTVQQALHSFILLRADISENTTEQGELLKHFNVMAPPTILFFNHTGKEVAEKRIVGETNTQDFMARLKTTSPNGLRNPREVC